MEYIYFQNSVRKEGLDLSEAGTNMKAVLNSVLMVCGEQFVTTIGTAKIPM